MEWLCRQCFLLVFPHRALGLTSRLPQECKACGNTTEICVMDNGETIEEAKRIINDKEPTKKEMS